MVWEDYCEGVQDNLDLIEDAKFYQDAALDYQNAYEALHVQQAELQSRYSQQAHLIKEASEAIKSAEAEASRRHQELLDAQHSHDANIKSAVNKAIEQYQSKLHNAQSSLQVKDPEHQQAIQKVQDKIQMLELSLASQVNLPLVGDSRSGSGLRDEVFNFIPGTVNKQWGVVHYDSQDQAFSFHKQVRFEDTSRSPDLKPEVGPHSSPKSSTPHHGIPSLNRTFDISQTSPFMSGTHQDAATIAAEVSTAVVAQASKEFRRMCEPKIIKFKGGLLC